MCFFVRDRDRDTYTERDFLCLTKQILVLSDNYGLLCSLRSGGAFCCPSARVPSFILDVIIYLGQEKRFWESEGRRLGMGMNLTD